MPSLIVGVPAGQSLTLSQFQSPTPRQGAQARSIYVVFPPGMTPSLDAVEDAGLTGLMRPMVSLTLVCTEPTLDQLAELSRITPVRNDYQSQLRVDLVLYGPQDVHDRVVGRNGHFVQIKQTLIELASTAGVEPAVVVPLRASVVERAFELIWWLERQRIPYRVSIDRSGLGPTETPYSVLELLENLAHQPSVNLSDRLDYQGLLEHLLMSKRYESDVDFAGDVPLARLALETGVISLRPAPPSHRQRLSNALHAYKLPQAKTVAQGALGAVGNVCLGAVPRRARRGSRALPGYPRVLVVGWYGTETAGDKAILGGIWLELLARNPEVELVVASSLPFYTRQTVDELHLGRSDVIDFDSAALARSVREYDVVLMGGGPLMDLAEMYKVLHVATAAKRRGVPFVIAGCGIGPAHWPITRWAVRGLLNCASATVLRDSASLQTLRGWKVQTDSVQVGLDPALNYLASLGLRSKTNHSRRRPVLGMGIRDWQWKFGRDLGREQFDLTRAALTQKYASVCDGFAEQCGGEIKLIPMNTLHVGGDDRWIEWDIRAKAHRPDRIQALSGVYSAQDIAVQIADCDVFLSMRYHSLLFASFLGVPTVALDYTMGGKVNGYAHDSGLGIRVVDLASDWSPASVVEALSDRLQESAAYWERLEARRMDLTAASAAAGRVAASFLA